ACLELPEQEWEAEIERLCARHPEDAPALRRRFAALQRAGLADSGSRQMHDLALVEDLARREPEVASALAEAAGVDPRSVPGLSADPRAGTLLDGRYELIARLGAGAMGVVYRGLDRELGREVAIKLLDPARFADAKAEARFLQEAELLAALRHDSVVVLYDRGRSAAGELFLVMELLDGVPLTRVLEGRIAQTIASAAAALGVARLAETTWVRQVARWGADLADGLAAVHRAGILHRDVKPANVFVRRDGRAVLLDFGIATRGGDLTAAGTVLGTPWYMAPEQALGDDELTAALDVYGLCS